MKKVILWGIGEHTQYVFAQYAFPIDMIEIVVDSKCVGESFYGFVVQHPSVIIDSNLDTIIIGSTKYYDEIKTNIELLYSNKKVKCIDEVLEYMPTKWCKFSSQIADSKSLVEKMNLVGNINPEGIKNTRVLNHRDTALEYIPKGGIVGEIGVAYGDFSKKIIDVTKPKHFYAIDFFNLDNPYINFWGRTCFKDSGLTHIEWYKKRFEHEISGKKMSVCCGLSWDVLDEFEDNYFDYLYIDACHDYDSCMKDTEAAYKKIKHGGIIQFNDYVAYDFIGMSPYGVVPVVNRFINDTHSEVLFLCLNNRMYSDMVVKVNKE